MKTKTYQANVKALDDDSGTFEALVSVFDNVDFAGDRVVPGAFRKSLDSWEESGDPIPVVFSHQWDNLDAHIGKVVEAEERDEGLWVKGQLDLEDPSAAKVHRLLKDRRLKEFSFAYDVIDERKGDDGANELLELELHEVGPTLKGMNPATELLAVKSDLTDDQVKRLTDLAQLFDGAKAGRVLSAKNEAKLREARDAIDAVLAALDDEKSADGGGGAKSNVKDEAGDGKSEEPTTRSPSDVRLMSDVGLLAEEAL